jgi:hypothetical protein
VSDSDPAQVVQTFADRWADSLEANGFSAGCPIVAAALGRQEAPRPPMRPVPPSPDGGGGHPVGGGSGIDPEAAEELATTIVATVEVIMSMADVQRSRCAAPAAASRPWCGPDWRPSRADGTLTVRAPSSNRSHLDTEPDTIGARPTTPVALLTSRRCKSRRKTAACGRRARFRAVTRFCAAAASVRRARRGGGEYRYPEGGGRRFPADRLRHAADPRRAHSGRRLRRGDQLRSTSRPGSSFGRSPCPTPSR